MIICLLCGWNFKKKNCLCNGALCLTGFQGSSKDQKGKEGRLAGATPRRPINQPRPERDSICNIRPFCSPGLCPPFLAASHLPLLTQYDNDPEEDSGGSNSSGSCLSAPLLLPPRFFHPSHGDRDYAVCVEWRVAKKMVVV